MSPHHTTSSTAGLFVAACFCLFIPQGNAQNLKSLISLSELLAAEPPTSSIGNVNIIKDVDNGRSLSLCYLPYLSTFSKNSTPTNGNGYYEGLASISLALEHLNTGNGTIVPELGGINQRCPLRFMTQSYDTESQNNLGVDHIITLTDRSKQQLLPCAILEATGTDTSIPTSIISGIRGFPQISALSTSPELDDKTQYKLFGRTIPNDDGTALALLAKLNSWKVKHIVVLHLNNAYGNDFADGIRAAALSVPYLKVVTVNMKPGADDAAISDVIQRLKNTQFTYFFGILYPHSLLDKVMTEAHLQKIAGTGLHTWLFSDSFGDDMTSRSVPIDSPLINAYQGAGILKATGGVSILQEFDKLKMSMQQLGSNEGDLSFLQNHLPKGNPEGGMVNYTEVTGGDAFLLSPGYVAPFLYDAAVGLGLAACNLTSSIESNRYFSGEELFHSFAQTTFEGTSGSVVIDPVTGTREPHSALFSLTNFIPEEETGQSIVQFKEVQTDLYISGEWSSIVPYTFNDGTQDTPLDLPVPEPNPNYLSPGFQALGLILCSVIVGLAIIFGCWTYYNRGLQVVRASQPIFLYFISGGTLLMGIAIIPFTIDGGDTNETGANAACMAFPWCLSIGFSLTFSALFTKTYRINQIMRSAAKFKRIKLTPFDVMKPMIALLFLNIVVLTVWTAADPLQREVIVVSRDPFFRNLETYSVCSSDHSSIFVAMLGVINLGSLGFSVVQAYQARNISTELSESTYIFRAMCLILYGSFLGIPIVIIARDNVEAYYFVVTGLIFVICSSVLLLIFMPKILASRKKKSDLVDATPNNRWGLQTNKAAKEKRDEEHAVEDCKDEEGDTAGIKVFDTAASTALEMENHKLKHLCITLSKRLGLDYRTIMHNGDSEPIPAIEEEDADQLCMALSKEDEKTNRS